MKKFIILLLSLHISTSSMADIKSIALGELSEKISESILGAIPGEGITEFDIQITDKDNNEPTFNLLLLRNLNKQDDTNLFTQFSLHTQDVGQSHQRYGKSVV